jgi:hypothetical protein
MKFSRSFLSCLALLATASAAFAATPAKKPAPSTNAAPSAPASTNAAPVAAPAPAPAPAPTGFTLDVYLKDLADQLKLTDTEKQQIQAYYVNDGPRLQAILDDPTLSPLQQAQEVASLRNDRNARITALLDELGRKQLFLQIEAKYRVALTLLAADGGLVAPPAPAPAAGTKS